MNQLTSSHHLVRYLLILNFTHFCKYITCASVSSQLTDTSKSSSSLSNSAHNLVYTNFHPDLRSVNLAAGLITRRVPRTFNSYFSDCTEKEYHHWYTQKYPTVCQLRFSTATTLKDLMAIYCDKYCGDNYLSYMKKCGPTAMKMANHYRKQCSKFNIVQWVSISRK